ncbi:FtsX-like permease family protein [uncultured Ruminococcus sp.]|uniref:FtsX-like permease family protein n=1 Tax=uncultured Ruminococcus sp. TaxID=165186 RepID=UPI0025F19C5B|nr:FtsX-like permease family protein [uncultured Ruminococcus sp.]
MNKVLRKRLPRDLKSNFMRYLALTLLIVMGMYIVISVVGAADSIIDGTDEKCISNKCEDGEFSVFIPLTDDQIAKIEKKGCTLEKEFSMDIDIKDGKTLRVMEKRQKVNLIDLDEGRLADKKGEMVIEKRFAEVNGYKVGDSITVSGSELEIVGIGSVPDYDLPVKNIADTAAESEGFGLAFVDDSQYTEMCENNSQAAEEYTYAYLLNGKLSDEKLKSMIKDFSFDYNAVEDKFFQETIEDTIGKKDDLLEGIADLRSGAEELNDGIKELDENSSELTDGAEEIFDGFISQANSSLAAMGVNKTLKADNYGKTLDELYSQTKSEDIKSLKTSLDGIKEYLDGTKEYADGVKDAADGSKELYDGVTDLDKETNDVIDELFDYEIDNLTTFIKAEDNPRIKGAAADVLIHKQAGIVAGVIVMILFTYVISVFVIHQIQKESSVIGAMYALGVKKRDLLKHYITLPTVICFIGGIIGTLVAMTPIGVQYQMQDSYNYFSIPKISTSIPPYLLVYSIIMPPVVSAIVNYLVINKRLSQTALSLIKDEQKVTDVKKINLKSKNFITTFKIRQMIREARTGLTVVFAMLISLLIFMIGLNCYVLCDNVKKETKADTKYEYMYTLKYPEKEVPEGGEAVYTKSLSKTYLDYTLDVMIMGIDDNNKYFDCETVSGKSSIVMSKSVQQKYGLSVGDKLILTDSANEMDYAFTINGIADYSAGLTVFMDIDSMRELFGQDDDYYNAVLSDKELDIDSGRIYSITTKDDINRTADVFLELLMPLVQMLTSVAVVIFFVVMYLMMNVMIDRAGFGISLIKIFGFRVKEIRKLYLNGNMYIVAIGAVICIPLSKLIADLIYPWMIANTSCGMNMKFPWYLYAGIFAGIMVIYLIINALLVNKLKKVSPVEVLKNRE